MNLEGYMLLTGTTQMNSFQPTSSVRFKLRGTVLNKEHHPICKILRTLHPVL